MSQTFRSLSTSSQARSLPADPESERLDRAFVAWSKKGDERDSRTVRWTPQLKAERWAAFGKECDANLRASNVDPFFGKIDLFNLPEWIPAGYRDLSGVLLQMRDEPEPGEPTRLVAIGGDRGRGKTAMASGLIRSFCRLGKTALYARVKDYFDAIDGVPWESKPAIKRKFAGPDLLVLDEVQVRDAGKPWQDGELTTLIDRRYGACLATVLLSNLKPQALGQNLGESVRRRLVEGYGIYETDWPRLAVLANPTPEPEARAS